MEEEDRIDIVGESGQSDWKEGIERSEVFVLILSKNWVEEPERLKELEYAKKLGKPLAVAVFDGINPEPYLEGADVIVKRIFDRKGVESGTLLAQALIEDFGAELKEKMRERKQGRR